MDGVERKEEAQRALVYVAVAVAVVVVLVFLWYAVDVVLLAFLAILLAILIRAPADWLSGKTGLAAHWSLAIVGAGLILFIGAAAALFGHGVAKESLGLVERIPEIIEAFKAKLRETDAGSQIVDIAEWSGLLSFGQAQFLGRGLGLIGSTFGMLANLLIVVAFAAFLAAQPQLYIDGFLYLVSKRKRARAEKVLGEIGYMLKRWIVGQAVLALLVAVVTGAGLALLGVPYALPLGVFAGLMEFVPYIGPFVAALPAILIGFGESPQLGFYVALVFLFIQTTESYILSPLVQRRAVLLPPAVVLFSQVVMGVVVGALGVAVATPLAATLLVAINMLYVQDVLGDKSASIR